MLNPKNHTEADHKFAFERDLIALLNKHQVHVELGTNDFLVANILISTLEHLKAGRSDFVKQPFNVDTSRFLKDVEILNDKHKELRA